MSSNRYPHLLSPGRIGSMELKNRIAVSAMGVSLSEDDGTVGERLIAYHEAQAAGGAGLTGRASRTLAGGGRSEITRRPLLSRH